MADAGNLDVCAACKGTAFYAESGFYFCTQCQTQKEDVNEQINDTQFDTTTRMRTMKIHVEKSAEKDIIGWTSWELYNFVLLGMTNELIEIGVDPDIKLTVLQLWTYYLSELEVAFTSKDKKCIPKMARRYHKKDAEIIYGKVQKRKKKRNRGSSTNTSTSYMSTSIASTGSASRKDFTRSQRRAIESHNELAKSQLSSDTDANSSMNQSLHSLQSSFSKDSSNNVRLGFNKRAKLEARRLKKNAKNVPRAKRVYYRKKYVSNQYVTGPDVLTPLKLWSIIYLALRIHNEKIYFSDMLRFSRENHLTYYKLDNLLPAEVTLTKSDVNFLTQTTDISHKGLRRTAARMAHFLKVSVLPRPDILGLIRRYCEDLELPRGIILYTERFYLSSPSTMDYTTKSPLIPNYEGRAMAYIIVVLKVLFGLDDITEKEISRVIDKLNRAGTERDILAGQLFNFCHWQQFIECRKAILASIHFPSKIKYDPENTNKSHLYLRFIGLVKSKRSCEPPEIEKGKHVIPQTLLSTMDQCIDSLNDNDIPLREMVTFLPSLSPLKYYIAQLDENSHVDIPYVMQTKFQDTKVGYITKPESLVELAAHCDISLKIVDNSVHYLEKIVPVFEQGKLPEINDLKEFVEIKERKQYQSEKQINNLLDYSFRNRSCKLKMNPESFHYYSSIRNKNLDIEETLDFEKDSYFDKVLPDGRLDIEGASDSEDESILNQSTSDDKTLKLDEEFFKKQKIELYSHELKALNDSEKPEIVENIFYRGLKGKFAKSTDRHAKKEFKRIVLLSEESSNDEAESKIENKTKTKNKMKKAMNSSEIKVKEEDQPFELSESDISILDEDVTIVNETKPKIEKAPLDEEILFRPFKDYWMYHCNFSRVKGKNFELFEKELPENFLWLLHECANMVEMQNEDLYEEVCLVEAYHLNILKAGKSKKDSEYQFHDCYSKIYKNNITNKW